MLLVEIKIPEIIITIGLKSGTAFYISTCPWYSFGRVCRIGSGASEYLTNTVTYTIYIINVKNLTV